MEKRTYRYDDKQYLVGVTITGVFCAFVAVACVVLASPAFSFLPPLMYVLMVIALYAVLNTFVAHAYPKEVTVSDDEVSFTSYGRTDTYRLADVKTFSVREMGGDRCYVRIDGGKLTRGRYWVHGDYIDGGSELCQALVDMECRINPDSLRSRARLSSSLSRGAAGRDAGETTSSKAGK